MELKTKLHLLFQILILFGQFQQLFLHSPFQVLLEILLLHSEKKKINNINIMDYGRDLKDAMRIFILSVLEFH